MTSAKESFIHARNLEQLLLDGFFSGESFKKTKNGFSNFFMLATVACNDLPVAKIAELYALAVDGDSDCIQEVAFLANSELAKGEKLSLANEFQKLLVLSVGAFDE